MQKQILPRIQPLRRAPATPDPLPPAEPSLDRYVPFAAVAAALCTLLLIFIGRT